MTFPSTLREERGFTLIELLIVMIILGILMAVAIPAFLGQKDRALATEAKNNATLVQKTIETCAASTISGSYSEGNCGDPGVLANLEPTLNDAEVSQRVSVSGVTASEYTVASVSREGSTGATTFNLVKGANGVERTCAPTNNRMCGAGGTW